MRGEGEFGQLLGCEALSGVSVGKHSVVVGVERPKIGDSVEGGKLAVNQRHKGRRHSGGRRLANGQWYYAGCRTGRRSGSGDTRGILRIVSRSFEKTYVVTVASRI